jgi:manganese oxidase
MQCRLVGLAAVLIAFAQPAATFRSAAPVTAPNPNTTPSGTLHDGVLTLQLDALVASWHDGSGAVPGTTVFAFAERGRSPTVPGPLVRVPAGTSIRISVRNSLTRTLRFFIPTSAATNDSVTVAPGATEELIVRDAKPGNYVYRATDSTRSGRLMGVAGALAGAIVVDTAGAPRTPLDRVMVMLTTPDSLSVARQQADTTISAVSGRFAFTINGRSWPNTERFNLTVGDTLHWRVINASFDPHPMHLHGFYYRVDEFTGPFVARDGPTEPGRMVVTQRMSPFSTMRMTWTPERPGNWLMHCHLSIHLVPPDGIAKRTGHENHANTEMVGLVLGISVKPRPGDRAPAEPVTPRRLRILVVSDASLSDSQPVQRYVIEENGKRIVSQTGQSPTLYLTRNQPVAITVVNQMNEYTAVHWHGMELESYYDGVAGLSGAGNRLAPMIAPRDSFVARFTPPRTGTFMYHAHMDDLVQQRAGLVGAMIVQEGPPEKARDDYEIFLKSAVDATNVRDRMEIGGVKNPDTLVVRAGRPARLRLMNLGLTYPNVGVVLTARPDSVGVALRDTLVTSWIPVAKDGADIPVSSRQPMRARQVISMGETYDFIFNAPSPGTRLTLEVRASFGNGVLLGRVPIRVE